MGVSTVWTTENYLNQKVNESETRREFIRDSELEFGMNPANLDEMTISQIYYHFDFLDYLWEK